MNEWTGYLRPNGQKGVRNMVLVIYNVECVKFVAHEIVRDEPEAQVIGFPGCYDNPYAIRLMLALARHPNVGAVLAVGLGCEYTQPGKIAEVVRASGRPLSYGNTNNLVRSKYWDIELSKTGYISEAGRCLVMQVRLGEKDLIVVLLDSWGKQSRIGDANRIRKWLESGAATGRSS